MGDHTTPIIIKRKKVIAGGGHHGGAWKVAYADFVTAMMAFFLLMWLLGATTEDQRKGIADYFNTTIPIAASSGGGTDALNGDSILTLEKKARSGEYQDNRKRNQAMPMREELEQEITEMAQRAGLIDAEGRVQVRITEEGTVIELVDAAGSALFQSGSAAASKDLKVLLLAAADAVKRSGAAVQISGHTDSLAYATDSYTNWELSADRANTARRLLLEAGVPQGKIIEVSGRADRDPISDNPLDPVNRRISILLKDAEVPVERHDMPSHAENGNETLTAPAHDESLDH